MTDAAVRRWSAVGVVCGVAVAGLAACGMMTGYSHDHLGGFGDACEAAADCAAPFCCGEGRCILDEHALCQEGAVRCNGDVVEVCIGGESTRTCHPGRVGIRWEARETCATACTNGACRPAVCAPLAKKCDGGSVVICNSTGTWWLLQEACANGCDAEAGVCAP